MGPATLTLRAAIDIGSHSFLLTIVDERGDVVVDERRVVRLGQGVGDHGALQTPNMALGVATMRAFLEICQHHGVDKNHVFACATSAIRRASNGAAWVSQVREELGLDVEVVSGLREATLSFVGALHGLPPYGGATWVIDIGGGSAEFARGDGRGELYSVSTPLGAARLSEAHLANPDPDGRVRPTDIRSLRRMVRDALQRQVVLHPDNSRPQRAVAVGGTATTLLALHLGHSCFRASALHGGRLHIRDLAHIAGRLEGMTHHERVAWLSIAPDRADTLLAGVIVLLTGLERLALESVCISTRGLRFGVFSQTLPKRPQRRK